VKGVNKTNNINSKTIGHAREAADNKGIVNATEATKNKTAVVKSNKIEYKNQTKSSGVTSSSKRKLDNFVNQALDAHNRFRQLHEVTPLVLDSQLSTQAQEYADRLAKKGLLEHDKKMDDGENLAMKCIGPQENDPTGAFFTTLWYQEVCNPGYDFTKPKFSESTGHFTQLAWKNTDKLGIGRAFKNEGGIKCEYVVARYRPAGNFLNEFNENVWQGSYDKSICDNIVGSKKHFTPRYTKHKSRAAKFKGLVL